MVLTHLILFKFFAGAGGTTPPAVTADVPGGSSEPSRYRKKKRKSDAVVIRYSDFDSQEAYAAALAAASLPLAAVREDGSVEPAHEDDIPDDDEIIRALFLIQTILH